jgi:hypothetical protein
MKNIFYLAIAALLFSCGSDPDLAPIITIDNAEIGAFPRTLNLVSGEYDLMNLSSSTYVHDLDFRSENGGENVAEYRLFIMFEDNNPGNGDDTSDEVLFRTFTQSDFGTNDEGNKSVTLSFPFTESAAATSVALDNVEPNDRFRFRAELELDDGRVFTGTNTESTIFGPAFRAFFDFNVNATCPLPDDLFVGDYEISFLEGPGNPWSTGLRAEVVTLGLVPGSTTLRQFSGNVIDAFGGFPITVQMDFVCSTVQWLTAGPGIGCGAPNIEYQAGAAQPQDITDDGVIILEYNEEGGGCGYSNTDRVMLTKI